MTWHEKLLEGAVIPAHPLALTAERKLDERRQRALTRYYLAAGAGGVAVGVHTTQFEIHDPGCGLLEPVLSLAAEELRGTDAIRVAGIIGPTSQALREAELAARLGYHAGLMGLGALRAASIPELLEHTRAVARIIPVFGFYLQPALGGRLLPYGFWREFVDIPNIVAIKIATFNRYQTLDVLRAVAEAGRAGEIALYTGNDDTIVTDLLTTFRFGEQRLRIIGGLLGQWAVWTQQAARMLDQIHAEVCAGAPLTQNWLTLAAELTDANGALFDASNQFRGSIAGIHAVLQRQGLLAGPWLFGRDAGLSPGQAAEIDRVLRCYPHLNDNEFVRSHLDDWLS
jgi:dihydrodipicolinate synthase/N-acetylneuraminate lyase